MGKSDLRDKIIPTTIENTDESLYVGGKEFKTTDLIYLDSYGDQFERCINKNRKKNICYGLC